MLLLDESDLLTSVSPRLRPIGDGGLLEMIRDCSVTTLLFFFADGGGNYPSRPINRIHR